MLSFFLLEKCRPNKTGDLGRFDVSSRYYDRLFAIVSKKYRVI